MRFGVELVPSLQLETMVKLANEAERLRLQQIWVCDHYHNRHVHSVLAQLALATKRVQLGPGVTNPYLVHPAVTAAALATLDDMSRGRAMLGISSGDPVFLQTVGITQRKPLTCVREAVQIIKDLWDGKRVDLDGECFYCRGAALRFKPDHKIPIYIGGRRRKMMQLAGEVADGALINACQPEDVVESIANIRQGLAASGRSPRAFDFVAYMPVSLDKDVKKAREAARSVVAFIASSAPEQSLAHRDISVKDAEAVRRLLSKGEVAKARAAVTDEMIDEFSVCGDSGLLVERVAELKKVGVTRAVIGSPIGPDPLKSLKLAAKGLV